MEFRHKMVFENIYSELYTMNALEWQLAPWYLIPRPHCQGCYSL